MVLAVVVVSFVKPPAFSRYFVVLLPSVLPLMSRSAHSVATPPLGPTGRPGGR